MSVLRVGLVSPASDESEQLASLLAGCGAQIIHNITPQDIGEDHVADNSIHVWLLSVDDDSWEDSVDHLLDESDIPVYFNEPGTLAKQAHPKFWCSNLLTRLYEITGESPDTPEESKVEPQSAVGQSEKASSAKSDPISAALSENQSGSQSESQSDASLDSSNATDTESSLSQSLDELELSANDLPKDIAEELVQELESLSPVLAEDSVSKSVDSSDDISDGEELSTKESLPPDPLDAIEFHDEEIDESAELNLELDTADSFSLDDSELNGSDLNDSDLNDSDVTDSDVTDSDLNVSETDIEDSKQIESLEVSGELEPMEIDAPIDSLEPIEAIDEIESLDQLEALDTIETLEETDALEQSDDFPIDKELSLSLEEDEPIDIDLEDAEPEFEFELASFDDDDYATRNDKSTNDDQSDSEQSTVDLTESFENTESELTLELLDDTSDSDSETAIDGAAQFRVDDEVLEEFEQQAESLSDDEETEQGGLSLSLEALPEEAPVTGRANFLIDEDETPSSQTSTDAPSETEETEEFGFELEAMEDETKPEWLVEHAKEDAENLSGPVEEQIDLLDPSIDEVSSELDETLDDDLLSTSESQEEIVSLSLDEQPLPVEEDTDSIDSRPRLNIEEFDESDFDAPDFDELPEVSIDENLINSELQEGLELDEDAIKHIAQEALEDEFPLTEDETGATLQGDVEVSAQADSLEIDIEEEALESLSTESLTDEEIAAFGLDTTTADTQNEDPQSEDLQNEDLQNDDLQNQDLQNQEPQDDLSTNEFAIDSVEDPSEPEVDIQEVPEESFEIPMLDETAGNIEFEEKVEVSYEKNFTPCWVIGASLGGPAAVKRFLNAVPGDINASFIIAQHIDENFLPVLADILSSSSEFTVEVAQGSNDITPGKVFLAPLKGKLVFLQDGSMLVDHSQKWSAPYSPCINDVIEAVSSVYREKSGALIFSGMGEDGLNGARKMRQAGGQVWAQSTDTCANSSMPEAVISNQETDFIGSPEELAAKLAKELRYTKSMAG